MFQFNEFQNLMNSIEPNCPKNLILTLFKQTCTTDSHGITTKALTQLILRYRIGKYGMLPFTAYMTKHKDRYKEMKRKK